MDLSQVDLIANGIIQGISFPLDWIAIQAITYIGHPIFWFIVLAWIYWNGSKKQCYWLVNLVAFSGIIVGFLKAIIAKPRPCQACGTNADYCDSSSSMPSGHATLATGMLGFFWLKIKKYFLGFALLSLLVMFSRIWLQQHFLSDVIVGGLIGLALGWIFFKLAESKKINLTKDKPTSVLIVANALFVLYLMLKFGELAWHAGIFLGFFAGFIQTLDLKEDLNKKSRLFYNICGFALVGFVAFPLLLTPDIQLFGWLKFLHAFIVGFLISMYPFVAIIFEGMKFGKKTIERKQISAKNKKRKSIKRKANRKNKRKR